jgi:signal transduction histidine kinase
MGGEREITIFIVIANVILLIFIGGIVVFIAQYRKRRIVHQSEKELMHQVHQQELLSNQIEIQTQTMRDIGREIHDNVGQKLTLASIYSNQLSHENPSQNQKIEQISKLLNESLQDLRVLSKSLVQPQLAQYDLLELLKLEAEQINQTGVKLRIKSELKSIDLATESKNSIFRLLQEFIQNSLKHAKCKQIVVNIDKIAQKTIISIADDGTGFDQNIKKEGIGLANMKRRANEIGADFELKSEIRKGTKLNLIIH